jgi:hypothetical protein
MLQLPASAGSGLNSLGPLTSDTLPAFSKCIWKLLFLGRMVTSDCHSVLPLRSCWIYNRRPDELGNAKIGQPPCARGQRRRTAGLAPPGKRSSGSMKKYVAHLLVVIGVTWLLIASLSGGAANRAVVVKRYQELPIAECFSREQVVAEIRNTAGEIYRRQPNTFWSVLLIVLGYVLLCIPTAKRIAGAQPPVEM